MIDCVCKHCGMASNITAIICPFCKECVDFAEPIISARKTNIDFSIFMAEMAILRKDYTDSLRIYNFCLVEDTDFFLLHLLKARSILCSEKPRIDPQYAIKCINRAMNLAPDKAVLLKKVKVVFLELIYHNMAMIESEPSFNFVNATFQWGKIEVMVRFLLKCWLLNSEELMTLSCKLHDLSSFDSNQLNNHFNDRIFFNFIKQVKSLKAEIYSKCN